MTWLISMHLALSVVVLVAAWIASDRQEPIVRLFLAALGALIWLPAMIIVAIAMLIDALHAVIRKVWK